MRAVLSLLVCLTVQAFGQSALPPCDSNGYITNWTNCQGTVTFPSGEGYVGEWRDGKFNGQGINTWPIGNKYVGGFREGMRHGQGTYTWADGDKYVGEFRDDKRHGQGILIHADGRPPLEGEWEDAKFVRAQRIPDHIAGRSAAQPDRSQQTTGGTVNAPAASSQSNLDVARKKCGDLGLKSGTEKFGECVLRLSR